MLQIFRFRVLSYIWLEIQNVDFWMGKAYMIMSWLITPIVAYAPLPPGPPKEQYSIMVFFFIHTFKKVWKKQKNSRKKFKNPRARSARDFYNFFREFSFFSHLFKGINRELYLSSRAHEVGKSSKWNIPFFRPLG